MNDTRPDWPQTWMTMAYQIAMRSPDPRTKTGCVIVSHDNVPLAMGYNGVPRNIRVTEERISRENGEKYLWIEHAERNAIYNATRHGISIKGATLYITWTPCIDCARAIVQCGIELVVIHGPGQKAYESGAPGQWTEMWKKVFELWNEAEVDYEFMGEDIVDTTITLNGQKYNNKFEVIEHVHA